MRRLVPGLILSLSLLVATACFSQESSSVLVFNQISIQLDESGLHSVTADEIAAIAAGSTDSVGITNLSVAPRTFNFCDVGLQQISLTAENSLGKTTNKTGSIRVLAPAELPRGVYVDATYAVGCASVGFPNGKSSGSHWIGFDAFSSIQAAVDHVAQNGAVYVAAGTYVENVTVSKPLFLLGPNVGIPGEARDRRAEAKVFPQRSDPENAPIISVECDEVVIDGMLLDGGNTALTGGYDANGVRVHAAAGIQNGSYPDLADIERITIRNNIITNISYDGICLDRYQYFGTPSSWNYIRHNKLANMWEGILTYALDSVIANNEISNVTHGLSVHCVTTAAPKEFFPIVASNTLTIAQWWPVEVQAARAPGIWINFRREDASPIDVVGNVVNTPVQAPSLKTIIGLYALTVDGNGRIHFIDNIVNGSGNCTVGLLAASCWSNRSVIVSGGSLNGIKATGALADTLDTKWGPGNSCVTVSNVDIELNPGGIGVLALQESATAANSAFVSVIGSTRIHGGACGVQVTGTNSAASIVGNGQPICGNGVGIYVDGGRALVEGNILTNNRVAGIVVEHNGIVDAGDCAGLNVTGLGAGTGVNGASAGLNDLSGYSFDQVAPWAITNSGPTPVFADGNVFNAPPGKRIESTINGPVRFSDSGKFNITAPPTLQFECFGQIPAAAQTVEEFLAAGGAVTADYAADISAQDLIVTNRPGHYTLTRTYTLAGGCAQPVRCAQIITARDDRPPVLQCSPNIVRGVDVGCDYATVTFTNVAADSCGELLGGWVPVSTGQFPIGTTRIIVIATDLANNSSACTFDIAVVQLPVIVLQPVNRTNNVGTTAAFHVVAAGASPLTFHWRKNGADLADGGNVSGAFSADLNIADVSESDSADYDVEVSNLDGSALSATARLTVMRAPGTLRILGVSRGVVTLEASGPAGNRLGILTSTNLVDWVGLRTNLAPFVLLHTNAPGRACRFYRACQLP